MQHAARTHRQQALEQHPALPPPATRLAQEASGPTMSAAVASGTPVLDAADLGQIGTELPQGSLAVGSTLRMLALLDLDYVDYIPLVGTVPIAAGGILDTLDRGTTYAELDDGVGIALTTMRGVNGTLGDVVDNVGTAVSATAAVSDVMAGAGWGVLAPVAGAVNAVAAPLATACNLFVVAFEANEGSLGTIQLCWDAYQSSRAAADGQQERAEAYAHMALDDGIDVLDAALSAGLTFVSLSSASTVPSMLLKGAVKGSAFLAFGGGQREQLHHDLVGDAYTERSRTPRGLDAWELVAEDSEDWWRDEGAGRAQETAQDEASDRSPAPDESSLQEAIEAELQERWAEFLEGFDVSAWLSGLDLASASAVQGIGGPGLLADGLEAAEAQLLGPIEALLTELQGAASATMGLLADALESHREDLERIRVGHELLDTMAGEVQGLLGHRDLVQEQLGTLLDGLAGVPGAEEARAQVRLALDSQIAILDAQTAVLEDRIAEERAILDAALGAGGIVETSLQAAFDRTVAQLRATEEAIASFQGLEIDLPGTIAWLNEVADALRGEP